MDPEYRGGGVLKAVRSAFGLSLKEAQTSARSLREGGYEGTYVEVHLLADLLRREGVPAEAVPGACA